MEPLISGKVFKQAQARLYSGKVNRLSDREMLLSLSRLLKKVGHLSSEIIERSKLVPSAATFRHHFGSLERVYELLGYRKRYCSRADGRPWIDDEILGQMRLVYARHGYISTRLVRDDPKLPSLGVLVRRFGSVRKAFEKAGIPMRSRAEINAETHARLRARESTLQELMHSDSIVKVKPRYSSEVLITRLTHLLGQHGYLSTGLIDRAPDLPSSGTLRYRFGSLLKAYELAGWDVSYRQIMSERHKRCKKAKFSAEMLIAGLRGLLEQHGYISSNLITLAPDMPSAQVVRYRFGTLLKAYQLAGWSIDSHEVISAMHRRRHKTVCVSKPSPAPNVAPPTSSKRWGRGHRLP
jgi:hypothetical protein